MDDDAEEYMPEWIGKDEIVRRQITEAVWLFFNRRDYVAIHTIIASAHQILVDLGTREGIEGVLKNTKSGNRNMAALNWPFNFMKHADRDPGRKINIGSINRFTQDYLMDAVLLLQLIFKEIPIEAKVYWSWYTGTYEMEFGAVGAALQSIIDMKFCEWDFRKIVQFLAFAEIHAYAHREKKE